MKHEDAPTNTSPWGEQIYDSKGQLVTLRDEASDGVFLAINDIISPFGWDRPDTDDRRLWECLERPVDRRRYGLFEAALKDLTQTLKLAIKLAGEQAKADAKGDDPELPSAGDAAEGSP